MEMPELTLAIFYAFNVSASARTCRRFLGWQMTTMVRRQLLYDLVGVDRCQWLDSRLRTGHCAELDIVCT